MTASNIISRMLGRFTSFPVRLDGRARKRSEQFVFNGYTIYALFLMISTAGIPGAIAKQTSHYNSLNEYKISRQLFIVPYN